MLIFDNFEEMLNRTVIYGVINLVRLALDRGADIHADNDKALTSAVYGLDIDIIKLLLDSGANIHALKEQTLLSIVNAVKYTQDEKRRKRMMEIFCLLVSRGADVDFLPPDLKEYVARCKGRSPQKLARDQVRNVPIRVGDVYVGGKKVPHTYFI